jgi:hypothetical protein
LWLVDQATIRPREGSNPPVLLVEHLLLSARARGHRAYLERRFSMAEPLPARANLEWLRKTAKQHLRFLRLAQPEAKLAQAQLAIARQYGFSSWRSLKAHADDRGHGNPAKPLPTDENIAAFLRAVGEGRLSDVRAVLAGEPGIVNAVGPHPFWGGRPQALHVSIETQRRDVFDLLIDAGADIDGSNELYEHWSPLMLTFHWDQPIMRGVLLAKGARIGLVEAMLFEDDAAVAAMLGRGKRALPNIAPNGGSLLAFARTPFAIDRLLELGVAVHQKDRWDTAPMQAMSRLGPRGQDLVRHLMQRGLKAEPEDFARLGDKAALAALIDRDPSVARADTVITGGGAARRRRHRRADLFKRLGLGSVLGYLAAGVAHRPVRPMPLIAIRAAILHAAELGVVMFLFIIGLEMEPSAAVEPAQADLRPRRAAGRRLRGAADRRSASCSASAVDRRWRSSPALASC